MSIVSSKKHWWFLVFLCTLTLTGCEKQNADIALQNFNLKWLDEKLGQIFQSVGNDKIKDFNINEKLEAGKEKFDQAKEKIDAGKEALQAENLSNEQKDMIDKWLEENGYNRYGDAKNAIYVGGNPLFDEATGKAIDRYDYILKKYPDILDRITN